MTAPTHNVPIMTTRRNVTPGVRVSELEDDVGEVIGFETKRSFLAVLKRDPKMKTLTAIAIAATGATISSLSLPTKMETTTPTIINAAVNTKMATSLALLPIETLY
jgi:hypothetical protein